jgi:DNA-binding NarL/FixJ family response regulator
VGKPGMAAINGQDKPFRGSGELILPFARFKPLILIMSRSGVVKIALIDEHSLMRECLCNYLSEFNYAITLQVADGKELISQLTEDNMPDICLLEFNARKKVGYETIKMLKTTWPYMKIMIYSMQAGPVENKTQVSGADVTISNQTSLAKLRSTLELLNPKNMLAE